MDTLRKTNAITFQGKAGEFFGIWIVNLLLSGITLGIYSAWAKVRTNRYFYGNTYIAGDNFEYHATPIQILKGRLIAFACVIVWAICSSFAPVLSTILVGLFYLLMPWLLWSNARFDSAMTSFRNVHFSFNGSLVDAYKTMLGRGIVASVAIFAYFFAVAAIASMNQASAVFFGVIAIPVVVALYAWVMSGLHSYFINGYRYGDWVFSGEIKASFFIKMYLKAIFLSVLAVVAFLMVLIISLVGVAGVEAIFNDGLSSNLENSMWLAYAGWMYALVILMSIVVTAYVATRTRNYIFSQIVISKDEEDKFGFTSSLKATGYIGLIFTNFIALVLSLGLARPWVMVRTSRYLADHTTVEGDMTLLVAQDQDSDVSSSVGDEISQAFDVGVGIS